MGIAHPWLADEARGCPALRVCAATTGRLLGPLVWVGVLSAAPGEHLMLGNQPVAGRPPAPLGYGATWLRADGGVGIGVFAFEEGRPTVPAAVSLPWVRIYAHDRAEARRRLRLGS